MAGTVTFDLDKIGPALVLNISWLASASDGTVTSVAVPAHIAKTIKGTSLALATTNPGATAPTDQYKITITDADGIDILGNAMNGLSSTTSEQFTPVLTGSGTKRLVDGTLTFNLADNAVNSALGVCRLYFSN